MASNGSCFVVTWTIFQNHLLEVGLPQNRETMTLQMLNTVGLFYFIMCEDPHKHKSIEIVFGWGSGHIWIHTTLEGPWPHYVILEVCWDGLWTLSFGLSQSHGHGSWLVCEAALIPMSPNSKQSSNNLFTFKTSFPAESHILLNCQIFFAILFGNMFFQKFQQVSE